MKRLLTILFSVITALTFGQQFGRPISDKVINGAWVNEAAGTTNLYLSIDETTFSDADYIETPNNPDATVNYEGTLTDLSTPGSGSNIFRYRIGKNNSSGRTINFTVRLFNADNSEIANWVHTNIDAVTTYSQTLTGGQLAAITSYAGLYFRINPTTTGGGAGRAGRAYWVEFQIPAAAGKPRRVTLIN